MPRKSPDAFDPSRPSPPAREVGRRVVASVRRSLAAKLAEAWRSDPERLATAVELGVINPEWVEAPGDHSFSSAAPMEVVERFLERTAEQRPSMLASLGLTALQILGAGDHESDAGAATTSQTLAVMFTDLENFTAYTADEGDAAASRLLAQHHRSVDPIVNARGGRIVKRLGDGLLLVFPRGEAAVMAGLELAGAAPAPLRLRAGAHMGEVIVQPGDVFGNVVNVAARVTARARGGEVLVTTVLRGEAGDLPGVVFGRVHRLRLKGISERVPVCRAERTREGSV